MEPQLADERQPLLRNTIQDLQSPNTALGEAHNNKQQDSNNGSDPKELSNGQLAVILGSVWVGLFLTALDSTIVATILTPISSSFSSLSDLSWLASAYFIANAASQPIAGRFTDVFGRRSGLIISNVVFGFGTLLCGLANSEWVMILARVVAGLGGGGVFAISTIVGSDLVPLRKRGIFQGLSNIPVGFGTGLGGLFGGWMNDHWGWKWAFLIQVPFIALAALLVVLFVRVPVEKGTKPALKRIDYLGTILLIGAVVLLLLGLNSGSKDLAWTHWFVITSLCLSILLFITFIYVEERVASEPIIPVKLLMKRTVAASCFTYLFTLGANFAILFYVPIYLQVTGLTTTEAGLRFVPQSACAALGSVLTGIAIRSTGEYIYFNLFIQAITVLGYSLLATLRLGTHQWTPFLYLSFTGLGYGGMLVVALISLISSVDRKDQAVVTSASFAFRSIGSILGICITSTIFEHVLRQQLGDRLRHTQEADQIISRLRDNFDEVQSLPSRLRQDVFDCYGVALKAVFATTLAMTICGTISSLFIKQNILPFTLARK